MCVEQDREMHGAVDSEDRGEWAMRGIHAEEYSQDEGRVAGCVMIFLDKAELGV